jgi:hypothetical protein
MPWYPSPPSAPFDELKLKSLAPPNVHTLSCSIVKVKPLPL